jgi:hypothetical protein
MTSSLKNPEIAWIAFTMPSERALTRHGRSR